jgi:hypothetical protein
MSFRDTGNRRHDLSRRAIAALEGVLVDEGLLHRMQLAVLRKPLDGGDLLAFGGQRQRQAGEHAAAFNQHRAGAALAVIAALLAAGQAKMLAQCVQQRGARVDVERTGFAVDLQRDRDGQGSILHRGNPSGGRPCCPRRHGKHGRSGRARHKTSPIEAGDADAVVPPVRVLSFIKTSAAKQLRTPRYRRLTGAMGGCSSRPITLAGRRARSTERRTEQNQRVFS